MKQEKNITPQAENVRETQEKRPYTAPELKEHGSAQEVTLQTFFGSFSPTTPLPPV